MRRSREMKSQWSDRRGGKTCERVGGSGRSAVFIYSHASVGTGTQGVLDSLAARSATGDKAACRRHDCQVLDQASATQEEGDRLCVSHPPPRNQRFRPLPRTSEEALPHPLLNQHCRLPRTSEQLHLIRSATSASSSFWGGPPGRALPETRATTQAKFRAFNNLPHSKRF
jgi:hypothetical protein